MAIPDLSVVDDEGAVVGVVSATSVDSLAFDYASGYSGVPLSTAMPTTRTHYTHRTIAPYLWGLLPDDPKVVVRWAKKAQVSERNVCGLLNHVGADAAGAFRYSNDPAALGHRADAGSTPLSEAEIAERLRGLKADSSRWHDENDEGRWSLAGAQAKIALAWVDGVGWSEPDGGTPSTHILKPAIAGYESFEINEHLCLGAARRLGLVAAKSELVQFEDQKVVAVERYDRSDGGTRRIHQEDMCQALGVHPSEKYQSDGGPTPAQIVERLRQVSSDVDVDVERFLLALGYNWLIVGTDAHAKNYSLLIADSVIRLAPLYDIASALPYVDVNVRKRKLAMKMGSTYQPHKVEVRHLEALAHEVRADGEWFVHAMRELADAAGDAFVDVAAESGSDDCRAMLPPILDWIGACQRVLN